MDLALLKFQRGPAYGAGGDRGDKLIEVLGEAGRCVWVMAGGGGGGGKARV